MVSFRQYTTLNRTELRSGIGIDSKLKEVLPALLTQQASLGTGRAHVEPSLSVPAGAAAAAGALRAVSQP